MTTMSFTTGEEDVARQVSIPGEGSLFVGVELQDRRRVRRARLLCFLFPISHRPPPEADALWRNDHPTLPLFAFSLS